jgi:methanogenic corrinoid protein MtbC1
MNAVVGPHSAASPLFPAYLEALGAADVRAAVAAVDAGLARGIAPDELVRDLVARGQREVGRLWQTGAWTVADEHAATAVSEQVLALLRPRRGRSPRAKRVVLACPEGEAHTMPARIAADLGALAGVETVMLGGGLPAEHLGSYLRKTRPDALALSVTLTTNLVPAWQALQVAHIVGVPVVVGGAAWGHGQSRARALGADLRLDDAADLGRAVALLRSRRSLAAPVTVPEEVRLLSGWTPTWGRGPDLRDELVRTAAAAVACHDPSVLQDAVARAGQEDGRSLADLRAVCGELASALRDRAPRVSALLDEMTVATVARGA